MHEASQSHVVRYVLRYAALEEAESTHDFPCSSCGQVDINGLSEWQRADYLYARVVAGNAVEFPEVVLIGRDAIDANHALRSERCA